MKDKKCELEEKQTNWILVFPLLALFLFSCRYQASLTYKLQNSTDQEIKLVFACTRCHATETVTIKALEKTTLVELPQGLNYVWHFKETADTLRDFTRMDIFKNDTLKSASNFLKTSRWVYLQTDDYAADYVLTVSATDF